MGQPVVPETESGWDGALSGLGIAHNRLIESVGNLAFDGLFEAVGKSWLWPDRQV